MREDNDSTLLILAPRGRDGRLAALALEESGIRAHLAQNLLELAERFGEKTNALLIAQEAIVPQELSPLLEALNHQPPWSDVPVIILTAPGGGDGASIHALEIFGPAANVTLLERPIRAVTLVAAARVALRARRRQRELQRLIAEREAAQAQAEEANRAKDRFLAMLSHELRTPLTPVLMILAALRRDSALSDGVREDLAMLQRNVELEALLIDDLLDVTRIAHGKFELRREAVDIHGSITHALEISSPDLQDKHLRVTTRLEATEHHCWADAARLQQVFWNLIKNAVKFTPGGGRIDISTRNEGDHRIIIQCADTGVGIEQQLLPRIFNAFEQGGRSVTTHYGGLGLGLAISKRVVDLHEGTISVESAGPGQGAVFTINLLAMETSLLQEPPDFLDLEAGSGAPADILLVEDHEDTARVMRRILEKAGYGVGHAGSVAKAKAMAGKKRFDLVVSDLGLPDGSGLELMRHLREAHQLPGIALSGFGTAEDLAASEAAGFDEHLIKPVTWEQLRDSVSRILRGASPTFR